ncbi:baeRF2 domain-containing protein [Cellulomonas soli]
MDLRWLKPLLGRPGPFTSVFLDATRADVAGDEEVLGRWRAVRRGLERDGAPAAVLDEIEERVGRPLGLSGPHGRVLVADAEGVRVDRAVTAPPTASTGTCGPVPVLLPAAQAADECTRYLLVVVDRQGADLTWSDGTGSRDAERWVVEGDHDALHKVRDGGLSDKRAEDSWDRNAEVVAAEVDRQVASKEPEVVLLAGDVRAVALVRDAVGQTVRERLVDVAGGSRAEGVHREFWHRVDECLEAFRWRRREAVLARYREQQGRGSGAVTALDDVVAVLQRGQVSELVISASGGLGARTLWVGPEPLELAVSEAELAAIGVQGPVRSMPADAAVLRAAVGQDAGLTLVDDGQVELVDGVGAVLRWSDGSTPSEAVPTQSSDQMRLRRIV